MVFGWLVVVLVSFLLFLCSYLLPLPSETLGRSQAQPDAIFARCRFSCAPSISSRLFAYALLFSRFSPFFSLLLVVIAVCNKHTNIAVQSHARDSTSPLLSSLLSLLSAFIHALCYSRSTTTYCYSLPFAHSWLCYCHPSIDHPRHYHPSAIATTHHECTLALCIFLSIA